MSSETFFVPHYFNAEFHKRLEAEYTNSPVKTPVTANFEDCNESIYVRFFKWINGKRVSLAACACVFVFVFAIFAIQFGNTDVAENDGNMRPEIVYNQRDIAKTANLDGVTDENVASQKVADANKSIFDKFKNKYMTRKFTQNFIVNDTVGYSTTQTRGITAIMRTIKEVVTEAVSGNKANTGSLPSINTALNTGKRPSVAASQKLAVVLREKIPVSVDDESLFGVVMVDKTRPENNTVAIASNEPALASDMRAAIMEDARVDNKPYVIDSSAPTNNIGSGDIRDYSAYSPSALSVKNSIYTVERKNIDYIRDILYEFRNVIDVEETPSSIVIIIDNINYEALSSRLKMSELCTFNQTQGRDYSMSYANLINKQKNLIDSSASYDEIYNVTKEIENLLSNLGDNTIKLNIQ